MAISTLPQNLQEAAVTICSEKFGCTSQESLPKFKENLFLMTAFKSLSHVQRTWGRLFKNWWGGGRFIQCMGKYGGKDSLEKGKYQANSYTAARVNVYYKLSSFFPVLF